MYLNGAGFMMLVQRLHAQRASRTQRQKYQSSQDASQKLFANRELELHLNGAEACSLFYRPAQTLGAPLIAAFATIS
jgi:hypothetical protein